MDYIAKNFERWRWQWFQCPEYNRTTRNSGYSNGKTDGKTVQKLKKNASSKILTNGIMAKQSSKREKVSAWITIFLTLGNHYFVYVNSDSALRNIIFVINVTDCPIKTNFIGQLRSSPSMVLQHWGIWHLDMEWSANLFFQR